MRSLLNYSCNAYNQLVLLPKSFYTVCAVSFLCLFVCTMVSLQVLLLPDSCSGIWRSPHMPLTGWAFSVCLFVLARVRTQALLLPDSCSCICRSRQCLWLGELSLFNNSMWVFSSFLVHFQAENLIKVFSLLCRSSTLITVCNTL